jgi:hypothetical protein
MRRCVGWSHAAVGRSAEESVADEGNTWAWDALAKDRPRRRKDIMGRKDIMHRTEGAVADLPAVKVKGIAVGGIAAGGVALRALATGALAAGAAAIGAFAIGAVAVGRLRVGDAAARKLSVGRLEVDELVIGGKPVRVEDVGPVIGRA